MTKSKKSPAKKTSTKKKVWTASWLSGMAIMLGIVALTTILVFGFLQIRGIKMIGEMDQAKLKIVDSLLEDYVYEHEISEGGSSQQMTGYGISDEDGVFYVTFDFIRHSELPKEFTENFDLSEVPVHHGIMYFWPSEHGGYSHAYSYHDDDYHPGGEYVKINREY